MKSETELRTVIGIYKFRIERDEKALAECDKQQREAQRIYKDCGTLASQIQIEKDIRHLGQMVLEYQKDIKKWKYYLEKEEKFLLYLLNEKNS